MANWQLYVIGIAAAVLVLKRVVPVLWNVLASSKAAPAVTSKPDANAVAAAYDLLSPALDAATAHAVRVQIAHWLLSPAVKEMLSPPTQATKDEQAGPDTSGVKSFQQRVSDILGVILESYQEGKQT